MASKMSSCNAYELFDFLDAIEKVSRLRAFFIEPPDDHEEASNETDGDEAELDYGGKLFDLSERQLMANANAVTDVGKRITQKTIENYEAWQEAMEDGKKKKAAIMKRKRNKCATNNESSCSENEPSASHISTNNNAISTADTSSPTKIASSSNNVSTASPPLIQQEVHNWEKGDFDNPYTPPPKFPDISKLDGKRTPAQLFKLFFTDNLMNKIVEETNRYAVYWNRPNPNITLEEMNKFIGVFLMSCQTRDLWDPLFGIPAVSQNISEERFNEILQNLHFRDNNEHDENDKYWKMRPLLDELKQNFLQHFEPSEQLLCDERVIEYYGKHECHELPRKFQALPLGYQVATITASDGYVVNFELYQTKKINELAELEQIYGKYAVPFVKMLTEFPDKYRSFPFHLYYFHLFSSIHLVNYISVLGYFVTASLDIANIPRECPFSKADQIPPHTVECVHSKANRIVIVRKKSTKSVEAYISNYPVENMQAQVRRGKEMPAIIKRFEENMHGIDPLLQPISEVQCGIRERKWWWGIFTWFLDVAVSNAWKLSLKEEGNTRKLWSFRKQVAIFYLFGHEIKEANITSESSDFSDESGSGSSYDEPDFLCAYH